MAGFIVFVVITAIVILIIVKKNKQKNERKQAELMNSFGYTNIVKPLQYVLEKEGYELSSVSTYKSDYGYKGFISVYDKSDKSKRIGSINFATYSADLDSAINDLLFKNIGTNDGEVASGNKKYMAVQNGKIGVLLYSQIATVTNPPDIPEWLMIGAKLYKERSSEFTDPDWVYKKENSDYKKYLNVMFR